MKKSWIILTAILLYLSINLTAVEADDVILPGTMRAEGTALALNGSGMQIKFIIKIYVAGLYLNSPSDDAVQIIEGDTPMAIRLHFIQNAGRNRIVTSWTNSFERVGEAGYKTSKKNRELFNKVFSSGVKRNDVFDIVYVPGRGTIVHLNGDRKAEIHGIDFKKAVFAFWLGSTPANAELKESMLGINRE